MNNDIYADIVKIYFDMKREYESLGKTIDVITVKRDKIGSMMSDLDIVLTNHGKHIYEHYEKGDTDAVDN